MGSGDLFHKRKAKAAGDLARKAGRRKSGDRVLIVCEGAKTEPNYLKEMLESLDLLNSGVEICGKKCGSAPLSTVKYAQKRLNEDSGFDRIFCVFDEDSHTTYRTATDQVNRKPGKKWATIKSVPCFEFWVLLHFKMTTKPFTDCDNLLIELKKEFGEYHKGYKGLYKLIGDKTDTAIANAKTALTAAQSAGTDNPCTEMHILVEYLRELKTPWRNPSRRPQSKIGSSHSAR